MRALLLVRNREVENKSDLVPNAGTFIKFEKYRKDEIPQKCPFM